MEKQTKAIKLEQRGRITLICASPQAAMEVALQRQHPNGWRGGYVPPLYAETFPMRLLDGEIVYFGACNKESIFMYPANFASRLEAQKGSLAA